MLGFSNTHGVQIMWMPVYYVMDGQDAFYLHGDCMRQAYNKYPDGQWGMVGIAKWEDDLPSRFERCRMCDEDIWPDPPGGVHPWRRWTQE